MTWGECKLAALQKMFSAGEIAESDEATRDYVAAMPFAANEAIGRIASVRPVRRSIEIEVPASDQEQGIELAQIAPDFKNSGMLEMYRLNDAGVPMKMEKVRIAAGRYLVIPPLEEAAVLLFCYDANPTRLRTDTSDAARLNLEEDAAALVPLYLAGELYKDDDLRIATYYMNEFETGLMRLVPQDSGLVTDAFVSESGW